MFENLKAFIRHGKQAKEQQFHHTVPYDGYGAQTQPPVQAPYQAPNEGYQAPVQQVPVSQPAAVHQIPVDLAPELMELVDPLQPGHPVQPVHQAGQPDQGQAYQGYNHQNALAVLLNYQEAAQQMVDEERAQRSTKKKYPKLDNYEVLEQMGEGAFLIVYKARHLPLGNLVAIKILRKFQMDQAQKNAVLKEVTIMRQLNHANVVRFVEFIDSDVYYYIVQELVAGGEIFTAIVNYTYLSEDLSRHIITQVGHAIRYLHEEVGVVHRDIKPENLLYVPIDFVPRSQPVLRRSDDPATKKDEGEFYPGVGGGGIGVVKLADFGLLKQIWETNTKTPCGTVGYTAPEIVRDERYLKEVDMWAIGCVLYTLLCGFPPFYDERIELLTEKVAKGEYTFLSPWWDEISTGAKHCVAKLLTVDPTQRYTIDQFLNDPWIRLAPGAAPQAAVGAPRVSKLAKKHPIQQFNQQNFNPDLYSPAAVALRDAFDILTAVHRMGEEAALAHKPKNTVFDLVEEEEDEDGEIIVRDPPKERQMHIPASNNFDLNLGGASILERRKNKMVLT